MAGRISGRPESRQGSKPRLTRSRNKSGRRMKDVRAGGMEGWRTELDGGLTEVQKLTEVSMLDPELQILKPLHHRGLRVSGDCTAGNLNREG